MHIPDGYLSPTTCAITYALALPFWYVAFARVKRLLHTRMVPLLAVFSAFSFVIMMFNLPCRKRPATPSAWPSPPSFLGRGHRWHFISIALLIQAVFLAMAVLQRSLRTA